MTTSHQNRPFPDLFARGRGTVSRADTEWESVMVQITLAFVIILGYLVSKGISDSRDLAQQIDQQQKNNSRLQQIVADFSSSETGRERIQRIAAQRQLQIQKLLNRWLRIRENRRFHQLVNIYRNAELVPLSDDLQSLPVESSFNELNAEIERIFPAEKGQVSLEELQKLTNEVLTAEGFDINAVAELIALAKISSQAAALYDDPHTPTWDNVNMLKLQIAGDLNSERSELVQIQYALVEKIAAARLKKLATLPLAAEGEATVDVNTPDLGRVMLERILEELRTEMRLLPETADMIRGTGDAPPATDQN